MGKFKVLYEDLKPKEKLGEVALEALRRAPLVEARTVISTLFENGFNLDKTMETLNGFLEIVLKNKFHRLDKISRAVGLGIYWDVVFRIKSLFPEEIKYLRVYDPALGDILHFKKVLGFLRERFGDDPRRIVKEFIRRCDVFKIRDDLYVVCVLFLGEGWKIFVVKSGKLVREPRGLFGHHMEWWDIYPYYLMFTKGYRELPKISYGILETPCKLPDDILIVDKFRKDLVFEKRNNKILMCTMTSDAGWEAVEYAKTIKECSDIKRVLWWVCPEVWEWWYGLEEKPDLEEKYSEPFSRMSEELDIVNYTHEFFLALPPSWTRASGNGHLIIESDGFDAKAINSLRLYFEVEECKKWVEMLGEFSQKYMLRKDLRKEYIIYFEDKS